MPLSYLSDVSYGVASVVGGYRLLGLTVDIVCVGGDGIGASCWISGGVME